MLVFLGNHIVDFFNAIFNSCRLSIEILLQCYRETEGKNPPKSLHMKAISKTKVWREYIKHAKIQDRVVIVF